MKGKKYQYTEIESIKCEFIRLEIYSIYDVVILAHITKIILYYIHTYHSRFIPEGVIRDITDIPPRPPPIPTFYQNYLVMSNTADVTGGKSNAF
jgi:hypothetical protein